MKSDAERQRVIQCLEAAIQRRVSEVRTKTSRLTFLVVSSSIDSCRCCFDIFFFVIINCLG